MAYAQKHKETALDDMGFRVQDVGPGSTQMTPDVGSVPKLSAKMYGAFLLFFCTYLRKYLFQFENLQEQGRVWDATKVVGFRLLHWGNGHKRYAFPGFSFSLCRICLCYLPRYGLVLFFYALSYNGKIKGFLPLSIS